MKTFVRVLIISALMTYASFAHSQDVPASSGMVNDFAGMLSADQKNKIAGVIAELQEKTSAEIAVAIFNSISPYNEIDYARAIFDKWRPGKKGKDNGVLILIAVKERRWRIETGYGLEGVLPDGRCGAIGRDYMVPYFKQGRYADGLYYGVAAVAKAVADDAGVQLTGLAELPDTGSKIDTTTILVVLALVLIIIGLNVIMQYNNAYSHGGGGWSGYGGGSSGGFGGGGFSGGGFGGGGGGGGGGSGGW